MYIYLCVYITYLYACITYVFICTICICKCMCLRKLHIHYMYMYPHFRAHLGARTAGVRQPVSSPSICAQGPGGDSLHRLLAQACVIFSPFLCENPLTYL